MNVFSRDAERVLAALGRSLAVIEFSPTGQILEANKNFCAALGYERSEIVGQHHKMFVDPTEVNSGDYRAFWQKLGSGEFFSGEFKRVAKGGRAIWIQATYNPVVDGKGRVIKIVKFASDITEAKRQSVDDAGKLEALSRSQAVIEFTPEGQILVANENFLKTLGYRADEIVGQHHRMFVDPAYASSPEYAAFWRSLKAGEFQSADFKRFGKGGKEVWIQASYNPIRNDAGEVVKVVKFATDLSDRMTALETLGAALEGLARGDVAQRIDMVFVPSLEGIRGSFNAALDQLQEVMSAIGQSAGNIHASAEQVSGAADDLSRRTAEQAAALEETSAALSGVNDTAKSSSRLAKDAGLLASNAKKDGDASSAVVQEAVSAMAQIETSSAEIGKIISVIDEIAFQTNLLALNAGVEAARAGEAGRGFAVVAQEVRGLAQRSAEAAKQIKDLITTSSRQVATGVDLVGKTGTVLSEMVQKVVEIDTHVHTIADGSSMQSVALSEINTAVGTLDRGTQQNAAMVEETTAASRELAGEAERLHQLLARFKLSKSASSHSRSAVHELQARVQSKVARFG